MRVINLRLKVQGLPFHNEIIGRSLSLFELMELLSGPVLLIGRSEQPFYIMDQF